MGLYTVCDDVGADKVIQESLDIIVAAIRGLMGSCIDALVLVGGFGRGEGGVRLVNGRFRPVNDFDIFVIVSKNHFRVRKRYGPELQALAERLAPEVGVKQIDISISHPLRFRYARNLVADYEICNGYKVLYGEMDLKRIMPSLPAQRLSPLDGAIYFSNRGSGLLIPALYFMLNETIAPGHQENFQIEVDKVCLAMGDAFLLWKRQYHYSYVERRRRITEGRIAVEAPAGELVQVQYLEAVERKLRPRFDWPGDERMIQRWYYVRDLFSQFFLWFESLRLRRSFADWEAYSSFVRQHVKDRFGDRMRVLLQSAIRSGAHTILSSQGREALFQQSRAFKLATMPMLLFSLEPDGVDFNLVRRGRALLGLDESDETVSAWQEATQHYLRIFHPEGVVRELLEEEGT